VYWSASLVALVPPGVVTVTCTGPTVPDRVVAVHEVAVQLMSVAAAEPNWIAVAPDRSVPVIVMVFWPVVGPLVGLSAVTVGTAR